MTTKTKEYIRTWGKRLSQIKGENLHNLFERFGAFYILYNRLYNESFRALKSKKMLTKSRYSDFEKATTLVVVYYNGNDIVLSLTNNNNIKDIETISQLLLNEVFHINLADGVPQREIDIQLMNNLNSDNNEIKSQAILSAIYNVRSNMQHGEKHFNQYQQLLLRPLISILQTMVNLQIEKLNSEE
jgi:hypothetical protein